MKANSLKDQGHLSSIKFAVKLNKEEYYHGEEVLGFIKIMLREEKTIYNIKLRFKQKEFWETSDNHVIREKTLYKQLIEINKYAVEHKNPNNVNNDTNGIRLTAGEYMFPFSFEVPAICNNTIEYSDNDIKAYITSFLHFSFIDGSSYEFKYPIIIKSQIPRKIQSSMAVSNTEIYKWGMFKSGTIKLKMLTNKMSYKIGSIANVKVSLDNLESQVNIKTMKLTLYRKFSLYSKQGLQLTKKIKVNSKTIEVACRAREKDEIKENMEIDDCLLMEEKMNVINDDKDSVVNVTFMLPSVKSQVLECEYYIKAKAYCEEVVFKNSKPKCYLPIQVFY